MENFGFPQGSVDNEGASIGKAGGDCFGVLQDESVAACGEIDRAVWPDVRGLDMSQPSLHLAAKFAGCGLVRNPQLPEKAALPYQRDKRFPFGRPATPDKPSVEVEFGGGVGEDFNGIEVNRDGMPFQLIPEILAQENLVLKILGWKLLLVEVLGVPDLHFVKEVKPGSVVHGSWAAFLTGPEKDGGAEDPLETINEAAIVRAILGQCERLQNLGCALEVNEAIFLPQGQRGNPDRNEAVLAEG